MYPAAPAVGCWCSAFLNCSGLSFDWKSSFSDSPEISPVFRNIDCFNVSRVCPILERASGNCQVLAGMWGDAVDVFDVWEPGSSSET